METHILPAVLKEHGGVFNGELGCMKDITVKLSIKPDKIPKFLKAQPIAIRPKVEGALVKNKVLEPVSMSEYATPIVSVLKEGIRICGDFKVTVNPVLSAEHYPLPHIDNLFKGIAGSQKFLKIE
jgi:hypothetical protein